jgi:hypothetical protein
MKQDLQDRLLEWLHDEKDILRNSIKLAMQKQKEIKDMKPDDVADFMLKQGQLNAYLNVIAFVMTDGHLR